MECREAPDDATVPPPRMRQRLGTAPRLPLSRRSRCLPSRWFPRCRCVDASQWATVRALPAVSATASWHGQLRIRINSRGATDGARPRAANRCGRPFGRASDECRRSPLLDYRPARSALGRMAVRITQPVWLLVAFIFLQTIAEVLPFVVSWAPWTQPQAMKYGGFVFIALVLWLFFSWRSSRD
jgi:hypothetical protein